MAANHSQNDLKGSDLVSRLTSKRKFRSIRRRERKGSLEIEGELMKQIRSSRMKRKSKCYQWPETKPSTPNKMVVSQLTKASHFETSEKLSSITRSDKRGGRDGYEMNRRSAIATISIGYAGLETFCSVSRLAHQKTWCLWRKQQKILQTNV